jgi:hypothetical protein
MATITQENGTLWHDGVGGVREVHEILSTMWSGFPQARSTQVKSRIKDKVFFGLKYTDHIYDPHSDTSRSYEKESEFCMDKDQTIRFAIALLREATEGNV